MKITFCLVSLLMAVFVGIAHADSFSDGKALANQMASGMSSLPSSTSTSKIPLYQNSAPQSSYMGSGGLFAPALEKINTCKSATPGADSIGNQECSAVNFLAKNPQTRVRMDITNTDPVFNGSRSTLNNLNPADLLTTESGCTTTSQTIPGEFRDEVCHEAQYEDDQSCTVGRKVVVDADSNFQCNETFKAIETLTCDKVLNIVAVQAPGCTAGQFIARVTADPCPGCYDYLIWDYVCTASGYNMHFWTAYHGSTSLYMDLGSRDVSGGPGVNTGRIMGPNAHDGYYCYYTYYTQTCNTSTCTIYSEFYNDCQGTSYAGSSAFPIPTIATFTDSWQDQCAPLDARTQ